MTIYDDDSRFGGGHDPRKGKGKYFAPKLPDIPADPVDPPVDKNPDPGHGWPNEPDPVLLPNEPLLPDQEPILPRGVLDRTKRNLREIQLTTVSVGAVLPLVYGKVRLGAKVGFPWTSGNSLYFPAYWCQGRVQSITPILEDTATPSISEADYLGTDSQTLDATLSSGISYTDTHPGVAYSVIKLNPEQDPTRVMAEIEGRCIYDPRRDPASASYGGTGAQDVADDTTWEYSANPALVLADFHQLYRADAEPIDWDSVATAADHCDEIVGGATKRAEIGFVADRLSNFSSYFSTLKEYALCFTFFDNGVLTFVPDKAAATAATLVESDIVQGSLNLTLRDASDTPDQVRLKYTNISVSPWTEEVAETTAPAGGAKSPQNISMLGWQTFQSAYRYATLRQNKFNLMTLSGTVRVFDEGLQFVPGDVIEITHSRGLSNKKFRVLGVDAYELGRYEVRIVEYQPVWTNIVQTEPTYPDVDIVSPTAFPLVTNLSATEKLWKDETGKYHTVFQVTFTSVDWPHTSAYRYEVFRTGDGLPLIDASTPHFGPNLLHRFVTPPTTQDESWTIRVYVVNRYGNHDSATYVETTATGNGKNVPPLPIPANTLTAVEYGQFVRLEWGASGDSDLSGYIVKRLVEGEYDNDLIAANDPWVNVNAVTVVARIDAERVLLDSQPVGTYYYGVRAIDRVGNTSAVVWVKQVITADAAGASGTRQQRVNTNLVQSSYDGTDTSGTTGTGASGAWNYNSTTPLGRALDAIGLDGLANHATTLTDADAVNGQWTGNQHDSDKPVHEVTGRWWILKDAGAVHPAELGCELWSDGAGDDYDGSGIDFDPADGSWVQKWAMYAATHYEVAVDERTRGGQQWWEVTIRMVRHRPHAAAGGADVSTVYIAPTSGGLANTGSVVLGNMEHHPNLGLNAIHGTPPMINKAGQAGLQNMSLHDRLGEGVIAYADLGDSWVDRFGAQTNAWPVDQTEGWIHNLSATATFIAESEVWDTDGDRSGNWSWTTALARTFGGLGITYETDIAQEVTWPTYTTYASQAAQAEGRFIRNRAQATSAGVDEGFAIMYPQTTTYQGQILTDQIDLSILNQASPTAFTWNKDFTNTPKHWFVLTDTNPKIVALDSVTKDGGNAKAWDTGGADAAATITIFAEGT